MANNVRSSHGSPVAHRLVFHGPCQHRQANTEAPSVAAGQGQDPICAGVGPDQAARDSWSDSLTCRAAALLATVSAVQPSADAVQTNGPGPRALLFAASSLGLRNSPRNPICGGTLLVTPHMCRNLADAFLAAVPHAGARRFSAFVGRRKLTGDDRLLKKAPVCEPRRLWYNSTDRSVS